MNNQNQFSLKWHNAYPSILKALFVLRLLGLVSTVLIFFNTANSMKYELVNYHVPAKAVVWLIAFILFGIVLRRAGIAECRHCMCFL